MQNIANIVRKIENGATWKCWSNKKDKIIFVNWYFCPQPTLVVLFLNDGWLNHQNCESHKKVQCTRYQKFQKFPYYFLYRFLFLQFNLETYMKIYLKSNRVEINFQYGFPHIELPIFISLKYILYVRLLQVLTDLYTPAI